MYLTTKFIYPSKSYTGPRPKSVLGGQNGELNGAKYVHSKEENLAHILLMMS